MPPGFPRDVFVKFLTRASEYFSPILSDEDLNDSLMKRQHFERAWFGVLYRYRACADCNEDFKTFLDKEAEHIEDSKSLLDNESALRREWLLDEEQNFMLENCLFNFFMSGLSVFESLGFCLYFLGSAIRPDCFQHIANSRKITVDETASAFREAFPEATITHLLGELSQDFEFNILSDLRNILAHRLSGRRNVRSHSTIHPDGNYTENRIEFWYLPGSNVSWIFDEELIERHLGEITSLFTLLASACLEFAENHQPTKPPL